MKNEKRKFKVVPWMNAETLDDNDTEYGLATKKGKEKWKYCAKDKKLLLFKTSAEAAAAIPEYERKFANS
jgi:hypothetical protein